MYVDSVSWSQVVQQDVKVTHHYTSWALATENYIYCKYKYIYHNLAETTKWKLARQSHLELTTSKPF